MAVNAANFTFTTQNRPSIFEVIAQKSLDETLYPAFQKITLFLTNKFPRKLNWLSNNSDEVFLILNALLQYKYLRTYDATFSEAFYGLKRVSIDDRPLSGRSRKLTLILAVLVPYFKRKLDEKVALYRLDQADGYTQNTLKKTLLHSHSAYHLLWSLLTIYNYIRYMSGRTECQLIVLKLIKSKLTYQDPEETQNFWGNFTLRSGATAILELIAFFLQFLQTWSAQKSNYQFTALPTVDPPPFDSKSRNYANKCPLCLQHWKIPTILPTSGYVFCFSCILRHLREHQKCPVTNLPAKPLDVVRIYENE